MGKTVSLVLGSGGARGLAHIGVIQTLEEHGYEIASISGCSMGAVIGGVYAAGKLKEFEQWVLPISKMDMVSLLDISCPATAGTFSLLSKVITLLTRTRHVSHEKSSSPANNYRKTVSVGGG